MIPMGLTRFWSNRFSSNCLSPTFWLPAFLLPALLLLLTFTGCGNSTHTQLPTGQENPFAAVAVGTDSTLEVMTWNLENFAKAGDTTTRSVIQVVQALDVDQEILTDDWRAFPRSPLLLLGRYDGRPIAVINNHLKCCGDGIIDEDDEGDQETRRQSACRQLEAYAEANLAGKAVFLIGDFNDELTDPEPDNVFQNFLDDARNWSILDMGIAEGPASGWSFPSWPSHLDHIIVNFDPAADALVRVPALAQQLSGGWFEYEQNISDHLPVITRIRF